MRGKPSPNAVRSGIPGSAAEVLQKHVVLEVEGIDRMYMNVYVPRLQTVEGVLGFIRHHRGHKVPSTAMVEPITRAFVQEIEQFVADQQIPLITFEKASGRMMWQPGFDAPSTAKKVLSSSARHRKNVGCIELRSATT